MVIIRKKHVETAEEKDIRLKKEAEAKAGIQDQYQARGFELVTWMQDHKAVVSTVIALFLVGGALFSGYVYYQQRTDETATAKFLAAIKDIDGKEGEDKASTWQKAQTDLHDVADSFPRSKVAVLANLYAGHLALETNDAKAALLAYQNALGAINKADPLYALAVIGLGYAQERNSDGKSALASFESVINGKEGMGKDLAIFEASRLAADLKENDKAKEYRERLLKEYPNSIYEKNLMRLAIQ
jgi:predicted negative regulator of RcsB-dependent stress response